MPRVLVVDPGAPSPDAVREAVRVLRAGGLVGLPTETVYGLAARALDERAIARVFAAKGRPAHHPLIAHVLDEAHARPLAARWPELAARLASAFWPGPLTLVVDRAGDVPAALAGGGESIAVRAPSHAVAQSVIAALGEPIAAPSANPYQGLSPTRASHVARQLGDHVDLVLDAGPCEAGIESTVVDVRGDRPRVLRLGALRVAALRAVVPDLDGGPGDAGPDEPRASPGMDARHYAPRAALRLAGTALAARQAAARWLADGHRVGLILRSGDGDAATAGEGGDGVDPRLLVRVLPDEPAAYARLLFETLHELDSRDVAAIVAQAVPADEAWWAVADRLRRASAAAPRNR
jgi:L-threonylcarbamoyladenylate synthase